MSVSLSFLLSVFCLVAMPWLCMSTLFFVCYLLKLFLSLGLLPVWRWGIRRVYNSRFDTISAQTAISMEKNLDLWLLKHDVMTTLIHFITMLILGGILCLLLVSLDQQSINSALETVRGWGRFVTFIWFNVFILTILLWVGRMSQKEEKMSEVGREIDKLRSSSLAPKVDA